MMRLLKKKVPFNKFRIATPYKSGVVNLLTAKNGFSAVSHAVRTIVLSKNCIFTITEILLYNVNSLLNFFK